MKIKVRIYLRILDIGPGKYENAVETIGFSGVIDPNKGGSSDFQNQSSIFKSNVERMSYCEPKIKTFIGGKLIKSRASQRELEGAKSNVVIVPEISPGPGDYLSSDNTSTFKQQKKPNHLQFFGSTEERVPYFDKYKPKNDINHDFRGPGLYHNEEINNKISQPDRHHKGYSSSFISGRGKDVLFSGNDNPAPGDYKTFSGMNRIDGAVWSKNSTFGTTEKRFMDVIKENPGPGAYTRVRKEKKKAVSGSVFKSGTKRSVFDLHNQNNVEI